MWLVGVEAVDTLLVSLLQMLLLLLSLLL